MGLVSIFIKRPVLTVMLSAVLILFGLVSIERIGVDRYPKIDVPFVSIITTLVGASPNIIDSSITNIIESAVNSVPGINYISSSSLPGLSQVFIAFDLSKDVDIAFNEVQSKVNQILKQLPTDTDPPVVNKLEVGSQPILWLSLSGNRTLQQLNDYASENLKKHLQNINGVGDVIIGGKRERTIRINVMPTQMAALNMAVGDIVSALQREHFMLPGGYISAGNKEFLINLDLEAHNLDALRNIIISYSKGTPIYLKQVASIEDALAEKRSHAQFNGNQSIGLGIVKISGGNTVAIINAVKERLQQEIIPQLPAGVSLAIATDESHIILTIIDSLAEHIWLGTLLAALVVLLFLKDFRSTIIIALSIPVSLLGAITAMYLAGFSFNSLTLLALILLIGIVVDDSIVVLENIHRHLENGQGKGDAALNGTNEVMFAVLAATFTIVAIFTPVIFLGGIIGRFFQSFAVVVTVGVLISLFISLSLTPMLCSRFLAFSHQHGKLYRWFETQFNNLEQFYVKLLHYSLQTRWKIIGITSLVLLSSFVFFSFLGKEFLPQIDDGIFLINFKTPIGTNLSYTINRLNIIEQVVKAHPEVDSIFSSVTPNNGVCYVKLKPLERRKLKQYELIPLLRDELFRIPGVQAFPAKPAIIGNGRGENLQFVLEGPNLNQVGKYSEQLLALLQENTQLGHIDFDLQLNQPQYILEFDRNRAQTLGLSAKEIAQTLFILGGGYNVAKYNEENSSGTRYDIRIQLPPNYLIQPNDLKQLYLRNQQGKMVRFDNVATIKQTIGPALINRTDLQYATNFYTTPAMPLGSAIDYVKSTANKILPEGYQIKMRGEAQEFNKTAKYISFAFLMAIILVYMVLASQFNSFLQPLILMLALPLAIVGGLALLWITGMTLNIYSMIGMVLLMGLVAKNSILLIDLTNQLREQGMAIDDALRKACPLRMRPVLMTSLTIILALLPAALGQGPGSDTNGPLSIAIIGGMFSSTLLTLIVIPSIYSLVENARLRKKH
ncbi:MAG: Multidrug resistance protein MdtB [Legionellaceae bacterium]